MQVDFLLCNYEFEGCAGWLSTPVFVPEIRGETHMNRHLPQKYQSECPFGKMGIMLKACRQRVFFTSILAETVSISRCIFCRWALICAATPSWVASGRSCAHYRSVIRISWCPSIAWMVSSELSAFIRSVAKEARKSCAVSSAKPTRFSVHLSSLESIV